MKAEKDGYSPLELREVGLRREGGRGGLGLSATSGKLQTSKSSGKVRVEVGLTSPRSAERRPEPTSESSPRSLPFYAPIPSFEEVWRALARTEL